MVTPAQAENPPTLTQPAIQIAQSSEAIAALKQGQALYDTKQFHKALLELDQAVQKSPDFVAAWLLRAKTLAQLGNYPDAMTSISKAVGYAPRDPDVWATQGELNEKQGNYILAVECYGVALQFMPRVRQRDRVEIAISRAYSTFALGYRAENEGNQKIAKQQYEAADVGYVQSITEAQGGDKEQLTRIWLQRGEVLRRIPRYDEALKSFEQAIQLNPNLPEGWFRHGRVLESKAEELEDGKLLTARQQWQAAFISYDKATKLDPDYSEAWNSRGLALYKSKQYIEAISSFSRSLRGTIRNRWELENENLSWDEPWFGIADSLFLLGCYRQASPAFQNALKVDPEHQNTLIQKKAQKRFNELHRYLNQLSPKICQGLSLPSAF